MEESTKTSEVPAAESASVDEAAPHPQVGEAADRAERPAEPEPSDPWKMVRKLALKQLDRFISLEPKVLRGDDPEAIHDLRVASRRLQQVLDLLYPSPRPAGIRKLRRRIRRSRGALGEVRNCDVQLARVTRILAGKRAARRETWEAVRHYLLERRAENFDKAARKLSKLNLAVFYVRLKDVLAPNGNLQRRPGADHQDEETVLQSPEEFQERVGASLKRVWGAFDAQVAQSQRDPKLAVIHGVRIAAKRLRYLVEVLHDFEVQGSKRTLAWLRSLQEQLGHWHDLEVLEQMMIEMAARPEYLRDHLEMVMSVGRLIAKNRAGKETFRQKYFRMTQDAEDYQQVKEWVAGVLASTAEAFTRTDD